MGTEAEPVWVFGYGSLLWRDDFPYEETVVGRVSGLARRFWLASTHHRGTPEAPGRVVTLVAMEKGETWGVAYKLPTRNVSEVLSFLNQREKGGYCTHRVVFHPRNTSIPSFQITVYIATEESPNYLGPAPARDIAEQVFHSRGLSGCNTEYILRLAGIMRDLVPEVEDRHLFDIEREVLQLLRLGGERGDGDGGRGEEEGGTSGIRNGSEGKIVWRGAGLCQCGSCKLFSDTRPRTLGPNT